MKSKPSRNHEKRLHKKGHHLVAGIDEAGKGAWAGPVVAASVILPAVVQLEGVNDSKLLSPKKRQQLFVKITAQALAWSVGVVGHEVVDKVGIVKATQRAMERAIKGLRVEPEYLLIDGTPFFKPETPHEFIVRGDQKMTNIAAAAIVAKVTRDKLMDSVHSAHPNYGFVAHRGYGTKGHQDALTEHGPSPVHRFSYRPIQELAR